MLPTNVAAPPEILIGRETIAQLIHPIIACYFETFNQADFEATAALFAPAGKLLPPFEAALVGPTEIAAYLAKEATGMVATPQQATQQLLPLGEMDCVVLGQVQTPLFSVNVKWEFLLNSQSEILQVQIRLLAALKDLLHLRPKSDRPTAS